MILFTATEIMFFTALVSAFLVLKAGVGGDWSPPEGVRLPVMATAFNTLMLFISGGLFIYLGLNFSKTKTFNKTVYMIAMLLGAFFVVFQGIEWVRLISAGMTITSDIFGATFYLLIGSHALHALAAVIFMAFFLYRVDTPKFSISTFRALQIFWFFIVAVWPVLYGLVYF